MCAEQIGIILLNFGGPDNLEQVEPFVSRIMAGRRVPPQALEKIKERYRCIGGGSPLLRITRSQAAKLEKLLNKDGDRFRVNVGMLHTHPSISCALEEMATIGIRQVVGLSLAPFFSQVSTGAYFAALREAAKKYQLEVVRCVSSWSGDPIYIQAVVRRVQKELARWGDQKGSIVFTAHSLPAEGNDVDRYREEFRQVAETVAGYLSCSFKLAFQSQGGGGSWLGPKAEEVLESLVQQGEKKVLVVPIGFVSDHVETLYDLDIALCQYAIDIGLEYYRSLAVNDDDLFIQAMCSTITKQLEMR